MLRNSHNSWESSTRAGNALPRWRTVLIALLLALSIGSVSQTAPAQAQEDEDDVKYQFLVDVENPSGKALCIGESRDYRVRILETGTIGPNEPIVNASITIAGKTNIKADLADSNIASLGTPSTVLINSPSARGLRPAAVTFKIKAKKVGKTTITFSAEVEYYGHMTKTLPYPPVPIEVRNCKFKVNTIGQWIRVNSGSSSSAMAVIDGAEIKADAQGQYTGSASVNWGSTYVIEGCTTTNSITTGQAELTGAMNESGQLAMNLTFEPSEWSSSFSCPYVGGNQSGSSQITLDPLSLSLPSSGGVATQSQRFVTESDMLPGSMVIVVIPEEDEAVAFIPDNHVASWDDFSSLFGGLLALH